MTPILEARGLTKRFGRTQALAGLDLVASPGRVVALLGPTARARPPLSGPWPPCCAPTRGPCGSPASTRCADRRGCGR
jgi:hypothetical protein